MIRSRFLVIAALGTVVLVIVMVTRMTGEGNPYVAPPTGTTVAPSVGTTVFVFPVTRDGPLLNDGPSVGVGTGKVPVGQVMSTAGAWIYNSGHDPLRILSFAPIDAHGLEVTDVGIVPDLEGFSGFGGAVGYPPAGKSFGSGGLLPLPTNIDPIGHVINDEESTGRGVGYWVTIGYRRTGTPEIGRVQGVALTYETRGETRTFNLPIELFLCPHDCP